MLLIFIFSFISQTAVKCHSVFILIFKKLSLSVIKPSVNCPGMLFFKTIVCSWIAVTKRPTKNRCSSESLCYTSFTSRSRPSWFGASPYFTAKRFIPWEDPISFENSHTPQQRFLFVNSLDLTKVAIIQSQNTSTAQVPERNLTKHLRSAFWTR